MRILFVCTGNTCRSPMAEAIMRARLEEEGLDIEVDSAGIFAMDGGNISINSIEAMMRDGIDISNYRSKPVDRELLEGQDLILTMSRGHRESLRSQYDFLEDRVFTMKEYAYGRDGDVLDPFGGSIDIYMDTKDEIETIIDRIVLRIKDN